MRFLILPLILLLGSAGGYKFLDSELQEPDTFNHNYFDLESQGQSLRMAYIYKKPIVPNGKTVLLLHGKNFSSDYWAKTIAYLNDKGYAVLAPDQVGFGRSTQPQSYQFSFQQLAQNTKQLLDSLQITNPIVIGHSMGGMLATRFALMYPSCCSKLVLENPIGLEDWKLIVPYSTIDNENKKELNKTREDVKEYMSKSYFHNQWKNDYEPLLDESERHLKGKSFHAYAKNMALTTDMIFTQPVCYEFKNLHVPVSLIIGQLDRTVIGKEKAPAEAGQLGNYPVLGKKTAAEIKNCQLLEIPGVGHVPHIEDFNLFSRNLDQALKGI
jgi:pimeloyl-ACP methyl ester carboxylesterase